MNPKKLVLWVIWFSLFFSLFMYRQFLGQGETSQGGEVDVFFICAFLIPLTTSMVIRWVIIPKLSRAC